MIKSNTAKRLGIKNSPTDEHLGNMILWAENIFQPIREQFQEPIIISSGYRSEKLNEAIGGSLNSQHSKGQAGDIDQDNTGTKVNNRDVFDFILDHLDFDQLILEFPDSDGNPSWVHVSYVGEKENRGQVLVAVKENGKTKYYPYA
jgi:hypothetical protein